MRDIAGIERMERGKLSVIRESATGAFYNLQYREAGKNKTVYVARDQVNQVTENTQNYHKAVELFEQYVDLVSERSRTERLAGLKKNKIHPKSSKPSSKKSKN